MMVESHLTSWKVRLFVALLIVVGCAVAGSALFHAGTQGAIAGAGLAALYFGVPTTQVMDASMAWRVWGRPAWVRLVAAAVIVFAGLGLPSVEHDVAHYAGAAVLIVGGAALAVWPWLSDRLPSRGAPELVPDDDAALALSRWSAHVLPDVGIAQRSEFSSAMIAPTLVGKGTDVVGRAYVDVALDNGKWRKDDFERKAENIASAWGVPVVEVGDGPSRRDGTHVVRLTAYFGGSAFGEPVLWEPMDTTVPVTEYLRSVRLGRNVEDGAYWDANMAERNFIVSGIPGSGKSSLGNALIAHAVRHPDVRVAYIDLKNGIEAASWGDALSATIYDPDMESAVDQATAFINAANEDMAARYQRMAAAGVTNAWTSGFLGPDEPVKILLLDEVSNLFGQDVTRTREARKALKRYVEQGRAAGYILLILTQFPTEENLPNVIRQNVSDRVAFQLAGSSGVYAMFGADYSYRSGTMRDPVAISEPGQAVVRNREFGDGARIQVTWLDDQAGKRAAAAESAERGRPWLDRAMAPVAAPPAPEATPATAPMPPTAPTAPDLTDPATLAAFQAWQAAQQGGPATPAPPATPEDKASQSRF